MDAETLGAEMASIVREHGPWGSANIALPHGMFTLGSEPRGDNFRTFKFLQIVADMVARPLADLRILDLASGEGLYAIEFAQHGAEVLGIEGRVANIAKSDFARRALNLDNLRFVHDDVRNFSASAHGAFDVILCSGILYHLEAGDAFGLLKNIREACRDICIIDTRIAMAPLVSADIQGRTYWGCSYVEHAETDSIKTRLDRLGSSLDNANSFWFTRASLANCLADLGFSSVMDCLVPAPLNTRADRVALVARAGRRTRPYTSIGSDFAARRWPDTDETASPA